MEPKITLAESWPWILIFIAVIVGALLQFIKEEDVSARAKKAANILLFTTGFIGAIAMLIDKCNDTKEQKKLSSNVDTVKTNVDTVKTTTFKTKNVVDSNLTLSQQIDTLNRLNNIVINNIERLATDGKTLVSNNIKLTNNVQGLVKDARKILSNINDEITGGISIPLLKGNIFPDSIPKNYDQMNYYQWGLRTPTGKWFLHLYLQNTGSNKITDISIERYYNSGRYPPKEPYKEILPCSQILLGKDTANIINQSFTDILYIGEDSIPPVYSLSNEYEKMAYIIKVKWRKAVYTYYYAIGDGDSVTFSDSYEFNGKRYSDSKLFVKVIQEYIRKKDMEQSN